MEKNNLPCVLEATAYSQALISEEQQQERKAEANQKEEKIYSENTKMEQ